MANLTAERPSHAFIESDRVEGSAVYRSNGDQIGTIERLIIEKVSSKVAYAIMGFGGFLGIGEDHYPVPWSSRRMKQGKPVCHSQPFRAWHQVPLSPPELQQPARIGLGPAAAGAPLPLEGGAAPKAPRGGSS